MFEGALMNPCLNGANLVVRRGKNQILIVQANYGEKKLLLPGGGKELGETIKQTAVRELMEETGLRTSVDDLREIAELVQRVPTPNGLVDGTLFLYETRKFSGEKFAEPNEEILMSMFMDIGEIIERQNEFGLAYRRMIFQYLRCVSRLDPLPFNGRLSNNVECPQWVRSRSLVLLS